MDHVVTLRAFPAPDTKVQIETSWRQVGGPTAVALSTAAFYGANVHFCGRWGADAAGTEIRQVLTERGIDLTACQIDDEPSKDDEWSSGFAQVWIDAKTGSRTIAYSRGEFPAPSPDDLQSLPTQNRLNDCGVLLLDGTFPDAALYAAETVKQNEGRVVLDAGSKKPGMETLLTHVDVLIASDEFCRKWFGTTEVPLSELRNLGPRLVIRTHGAEGAVFDEGAGEVAIPATKIEPVDTNGAGDIFSGALVFGLASDWQTRRCVEFANEVAGYACCHQGNSTWMPLG